MVFSTSHPYQPMMAYKEHVYDWYDSHKPVPELSMVGLKFIKEDNPRENNAVKILICPYCGTTISVNKVVTYGWYEDRTDDTWRHPQTVLHTCPKLEEIEENLELVNQYTDIIAEIDKDAEVKKQPFNSKIKKVTTIINTLANEDVFIVKDGRVYQAI